MLDACSEWSRDILAVAVAVALLTLTLSLRLLRIVLRATKRLRDRADLERRITRAVESQTERERAAVLPPAPRI